jgi:hypothetical protein
MAEKRDRRPRNEERDLIEDDVIGTGDQEEEFEEIDAEEEDLDEDVMDEEALAEPG